MNKYFFTFALNYPGTPWVLDGCENDSNDLLAEMKSRGFICKQLLNNQATYTAVWSNLKYFIGKAVPGDLVVFHNSSHGTQVPDKSGDEKDGFDEGICLMRDDLNGLKVLLDDDIWLALKGKKPGVTMIWLSDSCFGGGAMRLLSPVAKGKPRFLPFFNFSKDYVLEERSGIKSFGAAMAEPDEKSPWPILLISGSQENQPCYDGRFNGRPNGAFTYWLLKTLSAMPPTATYLDWYKAVRKHLPSGDYPQTPNFIGSFQGHKIFQ